MGTQRWSSDGRIPNVTLHLDITGINPEAIKLGDRPLWTHAEPRLAARSSQSNPRGSGPEVLGRERGHVTAETGVAEVGVFRALQPNASVTANHGPRTIFITRTISCP